MIIALYQLAHQADYRSSFLFVLPTDACFGSTPGIYQAEVLPIAVRSKVMGVTGAASLAIIAGFSESAPMAFVTIKHNCESNRETKRGERKKRISTDFQYFTSQ